MKACAVILIAGLLACANAGFLHGGLYRYSAPLNYGYSYGYNYPAYRVAYAPVIRTYVPAPVVRTYVPAPVVRTYVPAPIVRTYVPAPVLRTVVKHTPTVVAKVVEPVRTYAPVVTTKIAYSAAPVYQVAAPYYAAAYGNWKK